MAQSTNQIDVYLEVGKKRVFAGAIDWPGWCRSGRDEEAALQALLNYGPRYAQVLQNTDLDFQAPADVSAFNVVERLKGNTTTDFGAPDVVPDADTRPVAADDLRRFQSLLEACWQAFDTATDKAAGHSLRKGPRGGGRDVEGIIDHVQGADAGYLSSLGGKLKLDRAAKPEEAKQQTRQTILDTLAAAARGDIAPQGPRGGKRWPPRYYVRRAAWHTLDHVWEIEDRR